MKVDTGASGTVAIHNCFHPLAYCFFFKEQLNQKQITMEFQRTSHLPADAKELWIAATALN